MGAVGSEQWAVCSKERATAWQSKVAERDRSLTEGQLPTAHCLLLTAHFEIGYNASRCIFS